MNRLLPLLLLAGCAAPAPDAPVEAVAHEVHIMSTACDPNYGRPRADIAVQNVGTTTIEYPKAMVSFGGQVHDTYLRPMPLKPGGMASASVYANAGASTDCSVVSVVDGEGNPSSLR